MKSEQKVGLPGANQQVSSTVLAVDLDGTLVKTDTLHESIIALIRKNPLSALQIPLWLLGGKAHLKSKVASRVDIDPSILPYNLELLEFLQREKKIGRKLVLCTAADRSIAIRIAGHLRIFDDVIASDGCTNNSGYQKRILLNQKYPDLGYEYAGNSKADLAVWRGSRGAITVNASKHTIEQAGLIAPIRENFSNIKSPWLDLMQILRMHHWLKNLLVFIPLFAAHQYANAGVFLIVSSAFLCFCLATSSVYIINDLLDLASDRKHPRKKYRPFAAGRASILYGVFLALSLLFAGIFVAFSLDFLFAICLLTYLFITTAYSIFLKRIPLLDCYTLSIAYTLRIISGGVVVSIPTSFWLLAFSIFIFTSIAFVKRYAELHNSERISTTHLPGRGYQIKDLPIVRNLGVSSGFASVLVLSLYINSEAVSKLYVYPIFLWPVVLGVLYWISWLWLKTERGEMHDDPLIFCLKDAISLTTFFVLCLFVLFAVNFK